MSPRSHLRSLLQGGATLLVTSAGVRTWAGLPYSGPHCPHPSPPCCTVIHGAVINVRLHNCTQCPGGPCGGTASRGQWTPVGAKGLLCLVGREQDLLGSGICCRLVLTSSPPLSGTASEPPTSQVVRRLECKLAAFGGGVSWAGCFEDPGQCFRVRLWP